MFFGKKAKKRGQREQVMELQMQRETVKKNIRLLRNDMKTLIEKAAAADELDRKILALEYDEKKAELETETAHFNELSRLITQINGVAMVYERQRIFDQVASVAETIDTQSVLRADDMMRARKELLLEESDALDDVLKSGNVLMGGTGESEEFAQLVRAEKLKRAEVARSVADSAVAAACMEG